MGLWQLMTCALYITKLRMAIVSSSRISFIKLLELLLTITCVGLHYHSFEAPDLYGLLVTTGTFVGYLIILVGVYAGYLFAMPISKRIDVFYSVAGCALFVASGALAIQHFQHKSKGELHDIGLAKGSLAIINGLAFIIDAFVSFRAE